MKARLCAVLLVGCSLTEVPALAQDTADQNIAIHGQMTFVLQANSHFRSPYQGANSLDHRAHAKETFDLTAYLGFRPWAGAEIWVNPEIDQGFGLSNTLGAAGFPSGEAYKVGKTNPYAKLPRWFLRQTIDLAGEREKIDPGLNQLGGHQGTDRVVLWLGKFSVVDVFDTNDQAHDPRSDFMNWTIIDAGTFDYAANAWGYTYGAAAELYQGHWAVRAGAFDLSDVPNSIRLDPTFGQHELDGEIEHRHSIGGRPGKVKVTLFVNHGRMGLFADALSLAEKTGGPVDITAVRRKRDRAGVSFNVEQQVLDDASVFLKGGVTNGGIEPYEFTDVDRSLSAGMTIKGKAWGRPGDTIGLAGGVNSITGVHKRFLDAGGLGILIGDGKLPHPGSEQIVEGYYDLALLNQMHVSIDGQLIRRPGYNRDRGPVPIGAVRIHAEF